MASIHDVHFFVDITRVDAEKRLVSGYMTRGDIKDSYGTYIDLESVKDCLPDYMRWANVREMHQPSAVGVVRDISVDDVGVYVTDYIGDDIAWAKVKDGIYKGFSIGGRQKFTTRNGENMGIVPPDKWQDGDVIHLQSITEHSLVDRPSNEGCPFDEYRIFRIDGGAMKPNEALPAEKKELTPGHPPEPAEPSGSRHSEEDMARLNTIKDCLRGLGVPLCDKCDRVEAGAGADDDVRRAASLESDVRRLNTAITRLEAENARCVERIRELEAQPAPAKGALKVIGKGDDLTREEADIKRIDELPPEQAGLELIKRAHQNPQWLY